jgi:hypothetical protein
VLHKALFKAKGFGPMLTLLGLDILGVSAAARAKLMTIDGKVYVIARPGDFWQGIGGRRRALNLHPDGAGAALNLHTNLPY